MLIKEGDNETIGILLCKKKDKLTAEYALKDINKPVGVSEYKLLADIPEYLQSQLPNVPDITDININRLSKKRDEKILEEIIKPRDDLINELYQNNLLMHQ